jgi:shikimate 5-dehydrogenase
MQPHEIKPDTQLCTVVGYNAQTGYIRRYFNAILKRQGINAAAIALNLNDDNFEFTMRSVANSKVDKMLFEQEFTAPAAPFCDVLDEGAKQSGRIDFIEIKAGKIYGYDMTPQAQALFENAELQDDRTLFVAKMMLVAARWYDAKIDIDEIPLLIQTVEGTKE